MSGGRHRGGESCPGAGRQERRRADIDVTPGAPCCHPPGSTLRLARPQSAEHPVCMGKKRQWGVDTSVPRRRTADRACGTGPLGDERSLYDTAGVGSEVVQIERSLRHVVWALSSPAFHERVVSSAGLTEASDLRLTRGPAAALLQLPEARLSDLSTVAVALCVAKSTAARDLTELRSRGLVRYGVNPIDRRSNLVRLTDEGRKVRKALVEARRRFLASCLADFSTEERLRLAGALEELGSRCPAGLATGGALRTSSPARPW